MEAPLAETLAEPLQISLALENWHGMETRHSKRGHALTKHKADVIQEEVELAPE